MTDIEGKNVARTVVAGPTSMGTAPPSTAAEPPDPTPGSLEPQKPPGVGELPTVTGIHACTTLDTQDREPQDRMLPQIPPQPAKGD
jgi:hypothetical protein